MLEGVVTYLLELLVVRQPFSCLDSVHESLDEWCWSYQCMCGPTWILDSTMLECPCCAAAAELFLITARDYLTAQLLAVRQRLSACVC